MASHLNTSRVWLLSGDVSLKKGTTRDRLALRRDAPVPLALSKPPARVSTVVCFFRNFSSGFIPAGMAGRCRGGGGCGGGLEEMDGVLTGAGAEAPGGAGGGGVGGCCWLLHGTRAPRSAGAMDPPRLWRTGLNPSVEAGKGVVVGGLPTVNSPPLVPAASSLDAQDPPRSRSGTGTAERKSVDAAALRWSPADEKRVGRSSRRRPGGAILRNGAQTVDPPGLDPPVPDHLEAESRAGRCAVVRLGAVGFGSDTAELADTPPGSLSLPLSLSLSFLLSNEWDEKRLAPPPQHTHTRAPMLQLRVPDKQTGSRML